MHNSVPETVWAPLAFNYPFIFYTITVGCRFLGKAADRHCWVWCWQTKAWCLIPSSLCGLFDCGKQVYVSVAFQTKFSHPLTSSWTPGSLCVSQQSSALPPSRLHAWNTLQRAYTSNTECRCMYLGFLIFKMSCFCCSTLLSYISLVPSSLRLHSSPLSFQT